MGRDVRVALGRSSGRIEHRDVHVGDGHTTTQVVRIRWFRRVTMGRLSKISTDGTAVEIKTKRPREMSFGEVIAGRD